MNNKNEIKTESAGYELTYISDDTKIILSEGKGSGSRLVIPDLIKETEDVCTVIGKKAFFANKTLKEISLPGSVKTVDDWAFSGCENLRTFILRDNKDVSFGSRVFDKCTKIENICIGYEEKNDLSHLLGAVIHKMPAEYLLKDSDIGSGEWFEKWDRCLAAFINEPDEDGYTDLVLCGEEDIFYNEPDFAENKRKKKASLCLLRLMYNECIGDEYRQKFTDYLKVHTKGSTSEEGWMVLLEEYSEETDYYKLFYDIGCITKENIDEMLTDMGNAHAQAKAYMLDLKREKFSGEDIFSQFVL